MSLRHFFRELLPIRAWRVLRREGIRGVARYGTAYLLRLLRYPATPETFDYAWSFYRRNGLIATFWAARRKAAERRIETVVGEPSRAAMRPLYTFRVFFVIGTLEGGSARYRVDNVRDYLAFRGIRSGACNENDLDTEMKAALGFDIIVVMRAPLTDRLRRLGAAARARGIPVVFDIDDYVFEPEIVGFVRGIRDWPKHRVEEYEEGVRAYRAELLECDYFTGPTDYLAEQATRLGKSAHVIPNGLNDVQLRTSAAARQVRRQDDSIRIGYFSGTSTHDVDFAVAVPALVQILHEFPEVRLRIVGFLDLPVELERFADRIERLPLAPWQELPESLAGVDINLAPLELNNPFCEGKAEGKYFEAAVLAIPTVASPTRTFGGTIEDGVNGFLPATAAQWYEVLRRLVKDGELRRSVGERACDDALNRYTADRLSSTAVDVYRSIILEHRTRQGRLPDRLVVAWIIPEPFIGSGGHRNIFRAVKYLGSFGHDVTVYVDRGVSFSSSAQVEAFVSKHFFATGANFVLGADAISACDALFATHYSTAYLVAKHRALAYKTFYFVQDYEPLFYPMGQEYLQAENSYRLGLTHITTGPWCAMLLRERLGVKAKAHDFPIDATIYRPRGTERTEDLVVFFARPSMPRRCYPLGIESLKLLRKRCPDVQIALFGERFRSPERGFRNLSVLTPDQLALLYSQAAIGLSFSTTNPSMVPFEMMACGCPVVDIESEGNEVNYGSRENVTLAQPTPEDIADALEALLRDPARRHQQAENALRFVSAFPTGEEIARQVEKIMLEEFEPLISSPRPSFGAHGR